MSLERCLGHPARLVVVLIAVLGSGGCAVAGNTLGGREKCWPETDRRAPSIWRGVFEVSAAGGQLDTPEGDVIPLLAGALRIEVSDAGVGQLVRGSDIVVRAGDDVTLFGGAGADGALVVCGVEEIHSKS